MVVSTGQLWANRYSDVCVFLHRQGTSTTTPAVLAVAGVTRCLQKERRCTCKVSLSLQTAHIILQL